jgi:6-pyruvoyltetrahydropterin/6-carboxytetrahydropterin synthase
MKKASLRITKEFNFEMAHALYGYDGPCKNIHGHSYQLSVTLKGQVSSNKKESRNGMVMDFSDLKLIVKPIIEKLDHATMLNADSPHKKSAVNNNLFRKLILSQYQPTCENILIDIAERITIQLPSTIKLHHLKLRETPSSYAEWYAEDNK